MNTGTTLTRALAEARALSEGHIQAALAGEDSPVADAMRYACAGGKGLRGFLVLESARLHGIAADVATPAAAAIEAMHAYSLVHDDIPCMDNDLLRRGQPTVHVKWDEATAVLAGDALQSLAFQMLCQVGCAAEHKLTLISTFAARAGIAGMVGGQEMDIAAETARVPLTLPEIQRLQAGKTGALIEWSATAGAIMAGADQGPLSIYAHCIGLAFQIWDDVLDIEGDAETVGKAVGKDADAGKATFVSLLGLDAAKLRAGDLVTQACDALESYGQEAQTLRDAARFVISRAS
ncbi:farnesyl diphosphate synthase [Thalassovita sp.]|uniref:polyprenyl synthetase family protein n=1 Tax=Thalassovita sp. TaxID=1979401 RepID=UPI002882A009|nr:farnesyl diphosphate synthase [Thalassovita sp.]MDF1802509.1 polyprenyl synthetase family protein [Thalassovita sp.]